MMDSRGDAEGNYSVLALVEDEEDPSQQRMKPVAGFTHEVERDLPVSTVLLIIFLFHNKLNSIIERTLLTLTSIFAHA